jgi:hypothetical protein
MMAKSGGGRQVVVALEARQVRHCIHVCVDLRAQHVELVLLLVVCSCCTSTAFWCQALFGGVCVWVEAWAATGWSARHDGQDWWRAAGGGGSTGSTAGALFARQNIMLC